MSKILLLSMPFGSLDRPALGPSLLKAELEKRGHSCRVGYPIFDFAERVGEADYRWVTNELPHTAFAGDWCFREALHGAAVEGDQSYVRNVLQGQWALGPEEIERLFRVRARAEEFLQVTFEAFDWSRYTLVGFTSTFEQNLASLTLARRIKAAHPEVAIVFGGANWEGDMGLELHRQFPLVDHVCSGEADESFPALVEHMLVV